MRTHMLAAVAALALAGPARAAVHDVVVIDGDTVTLAVSLRAIGFDAPELHSSCAAERSLALRAADRLRVLSLHGLRITSEKDFDAYGRELVILRTPNGEDVGQILIRE